VDLRSREVVGTEALARFRSLPLRPPNEWFVEAVAMELGVQLELASVRQAMRVIPRLAPGTFLSINCSHRVAGSAELASVLSPDADRVVLEITEHEAIEDYDDLVAALAGLKIHGVRVAIDDVGAGFASLRHTLQIVPDFVKLDISLTRDIDVDRGNQALASALISFADEMGMTMIAEGIETGPELEALLGLGVPFGQGFFLAEPAPLD
jgi:EAL domain-containing protein (putative c-di-GMP-specific phosphodiesterase class I)